MKVRAKNTATAHILNRWGSLIKKKNNGLGKSNNIRIDWVSR